MNEKSNIIECPLISLYVTFFLVHTRLHDVLFTSHFNIESNKIITDQSIIWMIAMEQNLDEIKQKKVLLVCPDFPIPKKRKIQHDFLPIGLLKIGTFLRDKNHCEIKLNFGNASIDFVPDYVLITSLFTYWADCVHRSVDYYKALYPNTIVIVGGIYATLMPDHLKHGSEIIVYKGLCSPPMNGAESMMSTMKFSHLLLIFK